MAIHQGAYTPPGGKKEKLDVSHARSARVVRGKKSGEALRVEFGSHVEVRNGLPYISRGDDMGKIIISSYFLHPKFGVLATLDARWTGTAWAIGLAKRAEQCPDCHGEKCRVCKGRGAIFIPAGDTIQDQCARAGDEPGGAERRCPVCQAKKCPTCKGKGEIVPITWYMHSHLVSRGRPTLIKPGNTNRAKHKVVGAVAYGDHNDRYKQLAKAMRPDLDSERL